MTLGFLSLCLAGKTMIIWEYSLVVKHLSYTKKSEDSMPSIPIDDWYLLQPIFGDIKVSMADAMITNSMEADFNEQNESLFKNAKDKK